VWSEVKSTAASLAFVAIAPHHVTCSALLLITCFFQHIHIICIRSFWHPHIIPLQHATCSTLLLVLYCSQ